MIEPELCLRIEEKNPTDRVRGTIVNATEGGMFVVQYDNGDYVAYGPECQGDFKSASDKPVPSHAAELIHRLRRKYGKVPPEDVGVLRLEDNAGVPHPRSKHMRRASEALTAHDNPPSIEA